MVENGSNVSSLVDELEVLSSHSRVEPGDGQLPGSAECTVLLAVFSEGMESWVELV